MKMQRQYRSKLNLTVDITSLLTCITSTSTDLADTQLQGLWFAINWSRTPGNELIPELAEHEETLLSLMEIIDDFQSILRAERYGVPVPCLVDVESNNYSVRV